MDGVEGTVAHVCRPRTPITGRSLTSTGKHTYRHRRGCRGRAVANDARREGRDAKTRYTSTNFTKEPPLQKNPPQNLGETATEH